MRFNYINYDGKIKFVNLNGLLFKNFFNLKLLYQFFIYYSSQYRILTSSQKSRSFINFSTKKFYKQKGTGKARVGSRSSPIRIGGSRSFPNFYYENYKLFFSKNMYKLSFLIIYSQIFINNFFFLIEDLFFIEIKCKLVFFKFFNFLKYNNLIITFKVEKNFFLSSINCKFVKLIYFLNFNPLLLLKFDKFLITRSSINYINKI